MRRFISALLILMPCYSCACECALDFRGLVVSRDQLERQGDRERGRSLRDVAEQRCSICYFDVRRIVADVDRDSFIGSFATQSPSAHARIRASSA